MPPIQRARINPRVLRWARESSLISLDSAADRLGVRTDRIQSWESGDAFPTVRQAQAAATLYKRPFAALYLPEPPADDPPPPDFRRLPGGGTPETSPELALEIRRAHYRRDAALTLSRNLEVDLPDPGTVDGNRHTLEAAALEVRERLGMGPGAERGWRTPYDALNSWKDSIESNGVLVFHFTGVRVSEARAFSIADRPLPVISVNGEDTPHGRIFSVLHEFGHVLLGRSGNCNFVDYFEVGEAGLVEQYCNAFAAAVVLPSGQLLQDPTVVRHGTTPRWTDEELSTLSRTYRASKEAVLRRLLTLGRTTTTEYQAWRNEWNLAEQPPAAGGFMTWPQRAIRSAGHLFGGLVLDAYRREAITSADVAEYLGVRIKHLPEIERRLEGRSMLTGGRG